MKTKWERINREHGRRKSNYKSFDKAIDLHFSYNTPTNKRDLSSEMEDYGFHVVGNEKQSPTDKQLNHAWEYILKNYLPKQKEITDYYKIEKTGISHVTRKPNYRYRATRNIIYKNKKYRRGQFLPKQKEITDYYKIETTGISHVTRKPNYRYRATRNIIYKNKKYRRGQFLPKQEMLDIE